MAKVLVIGSGGREHAICWKFHQSPLVDTVYVAPGNAGMRDVAQIVPIDSMDFASLIAFVKKEQIDLTFVGPEIPLCEGIVDAFEQEGLCIFGPTKAAAELEGSKVFSKYMMKKYAIPTAAYEAFDSFENAKAYIENTDHRVVIKADGLAAGKGVIIPTTKEEAIEAVDEIMNHGLFKEAGKQVVIEEFLEGEEFSLLAFVNGEDVYPMQIAQDHKRAFDNDEGLNTGGMGAYTPVSHISEAIINEAMENVMKPMAKAMVVEGRPFVGILYGGMMATTKGVKTIEFNVRGGDPETEVILQSLQNDLYVVIQDLLAHKPLELQFSKECFVGVVLASKGYPEAYTKGATIHGLDTINDVVLHMGTAIKDDELVVNGGRVLFVSAHAPTMQEAVTNVYKNVAKIKCESLFYRHDIAARALAQQEVL